MHYIRIRPNVQASKVGADARYVTGFRSGTDIYFVIPPQNAQVFAVALSGCFAVVDSDGDIVQSPYLNAINLDPHVGTFGLFSSTRVERAFQANVIENWTQNPLAISFISRTEHDGNTFISNSAGNSVFPFLNDLSGHKTFGLPSNPRLAGELPLPYASTLAGFSTTAMRPFFYTPCMGLLLNSVPKNLAALGGLQFCFSVARFGDVGNQDIPTPGEDNAGIFNVFNPILIHQTAPMILQSCKNFQLVVIDPVMDVLLEPGQGSEITSIQFNSLDINRSQTVPSLNQHFTAPFGSVLVKSLYYFMIYKPNTTVGHISSLQTSAFKQTDFSLYINGQRQIYAYPTNTVDPSLVLSQFTPNSFIFNVQATPNRYQLLDKIWNGAMQVFDYNLDGAGTLFENVNVTFQLFLANISQTSGTYTFSDPAPNGNILQDSSFSERNTLSANYTEVEQQAPVRFSQSLLMTPTRKFSQVLSVENKTDVVTTTLNTKTLVINPTAATIVPEASTSTKIPKFLRFQTAAPPSTVNRTLEFVISGQKMNTALPGTVGYEFLLPDSGRLGNMFLFYQMQPLNVQELMTGYSIRPNLWQNLNAAFVAANPFFYSIVPGTNNTNTIAAENPPFGILNGNIIAAGGFSRSAWPTLPYGGNVCYNRCGYSSILGSTSLVAAVEWLLPGGVTLQRYNLQANKFLNHYGDRHTDDLSEYEFTTHVTSGYFYDDRYDGKIRDIVPSREENRAFDSWQSVFQISSTNDRLSDMPPNFVYRQCTNLVDVDVSFKQMIGTMLTTTQKRYVRIYFDLSASGISNVSAGLGMGMFTEASINKAVCNKSGPIVAPMDGNLAEPLLVPNYYPQITVGMPALCYQGSQINENVPITLNVQCIYDDPQTTKALNEQFMANGVTMTMTQFDYQRRYAEANGGNSISPTIEIPIGGRNPKLVNIAHKYLKDFNGVLQPRAQVPSLGVLGRNAGLRLYDDLLSVPFYIAARDGAMAYSVPRNTPTNVLNSNLGMSEFTPLVDNTMMYTFSLGSSALNALFYAIAYRGPLQLPDHQVSSLAYRSTIVYQTPLVQNQNSNPGLLYSLNAGAANTTVDSQGRGIQQPLVYQFSISPFSTQYVGQNALESHAWAPQYLQCYALGYDNCPLNPTRFVTCIPFLPEHENGNILTIADSLTAIRHNFRGVENPIYNSFQNYFTTILDLAGVVDFWSLAQSMYNYKYLMAEYAILEAVQVFFNHEHASIRYLYPTGQIVV